MAVTEPEARNRHIHGSNIKSKTIFPRVLSPCTQDGSDFAIPYTLEVTVANASTNINSAVVPVKSIVKGFRAVKSAANGGAGDLVQLKDQDGNAISNALDLNVATDGGVVNATQLDPAHSTIPVGEYLIIDPTSVTDCSCKVFVDLLPIT